MVLRPQVALRANKRAKGPTVLAEPGSAIVGPAVADNKRSTGQRFIHGGTTSVSVSISYSPPPSSYRQVARLIRFAEHFHRSFRCKLMIEATLQRSAVSDIRWLTY